MLSRDETVADSTLLPNWILVDGGTSGAIQSAILEHTKIATAEQPASQQVSLYQFTQQQWAVLLDSNCPPYHVTNLIAWLEWEQVNPGVRSVVGWLNSSGSRDRYFLCTDQANPSGDTLIGVRADGNTVSIFLPDCSLTEQTISVPAQPEPELDFENLERVASFEAIFDMNRSFGNPEFVIE